MIIGDPYKFAVMFDIVKEWNVSLSDENGFFALCIDGKLFPNIVINACVFSSVYDVIESLNSIPVNEEIYEMEKEKAFMSLYELVYPDFDNDRDNDYRYLISTSDLTDLRYLVFAVEGKGKIKLFATKTEYNFEEERDIFDNLEITEIILEKDEINRIIIQLEEIMQSHDFSYK